MNNCLMTPKPDLALDDIAGTRTDRAGKLFLVLRGELRRCLICENVFAVCSIESRLALDEESEKRSLPGRVMLAITWAVPVYR